MKNPATDVQFLKRRDGTDGSFAVVFPKMESHIPKGTLYDRKYNMPRRPGVFQAIKNQYNKHRTDRTNKDDVPDLINP
jgi:hypothetical protein